MRLGTRVHHAHGYKTLPQILEFFAEGLNCGHSKSKKVFYHRISAACWIFR